MAKKRRTFTPAFKAKVALAAARGDKTLSQLAPKYGVHVNQISKWKAQLLSGAAELFEDGRARRTEDNDKEEATLYEQIGRLKVELDWLKTNRTNSAEALRGVVDPAHASISIRRQCELLGLNRSTIYYEPQGESPENLELMRRIDEFHTEQPSLDCRIPHDVYVEGA